MTEIDVTIFAGALMVLRLTSLYFVGDVIIKQLNIWGRVKRAGAIERGKNFRVLLFALAVAMLLKNIVPVGIDLVAILTIGHLTLEFASLSDSLIIQYFTSNAVFDLIMSVIIWLLYREARRYT